MPSVAFTLLRFAFRITTFLILCGTFTVLTTLAVMPSAFTVMLPAVPVMLAVTPVTASTFAARTFLICGALGLRTRFLFCLLCLIGCLYIRMLTFMSRMSISRS